MSKFCGRHLNDINDALRRRDLMALCNDDPHVVSDLARKWMSGESNQHEFDPRVVLMLELHAKCHRIGVPRVTPRCSLCAAEAILKQPSLAPTWIEAGANLMVDLRNAIVRKMSKKEVRAASELSQ